ncbi:hypothetical protein PV797_06485 [Clostridiaceae bacterium M8S5]|nr:hypothetical protein PV797_06485 [Clostridiaceae bacterium M8S5]
MLEERIENLVLNSVIGDCINFKKNKKYNQYTFYHRGQLCMSYISQQMIIMIKSLIPSLKEISVNCDITRLGKELDLWQEYKISSNKSLNLSNADIYWKEYDDSLTSRILPIIIVNNDFKVITDEIIKVAFKTTGNIENLIETIALARIYYNIVNDLDINYDTIIKEIKQDIINISVKDIIENIEFKFSLKTYNGKYIIDFERCRIEMLNMLNSINSNRFSVFRESLNIIKDKVNTYESVEATFTNYLIVSGFSNKKIQLDFINKSFIKNLISYLIKLRKGRISPEQLEIKNHSYPNVFKFNKGNEFYHTLLNRCKVIGKKDDDNEIKMLIQNKSAIYGFKKAKI